VVVAADRQDAAQRRSAQHVRIAEHVARPVDAVALAVPDAEDTIGLGRTISLVHLRAPQGGGGQILVQTRLEDDVMRVEVRLCLPQLLVVSSDGRAAIAGDQARRPQAPMLVEAPLHQRQAHEGLNAGHEGRAGLGLVDGVQADDPLVSHCRSPCGSESSRETRGRVAKHGAIKRLI
jgi:hypothetical protein